MSNLSEVFPQPVKLDLASEYKSAVIAFGSMRLKENIPPFEWTKFLAGIPTNRIYVRDLQKLWYLQGLPGICDSPEGINAYLRQIVAERNIEKTITVGGSMGGYAALLFGHLLHVDEVHAFAAQTFLPARKGRTLVKTVLARNWQILRKQWELVSDRRLNRRYFDLKPLLECDTGQTQYHIYFSTDNEKDIIHAQRMSSLSNVHLHRRTHDGHHVSVAMRNSGELKEILMQTIQKDHHARKEGHLS